MYQKIIENIEDTKPQNRTVSNWIRQACIDKLELLGLIQAEEDQ